MRAGLGRVAVNERDVATFGLGAVDGLLESRVACVRLCVWVGGWVGVGVGVGVCVWCGWVDVCATVQRADPTEETLDLNYHLMAHLCVAHLCT